MPSAIKNEGKQHENRWLAHLMRKSVTPLYFVLGGTPQGVPPKRYEVPGSRFRQIVPFQSDDSGPHRQAHDRRRLPPEQPTRKGDHTWLT